MNVAESLAYHKARPDVSLNSYVRTKRITLARSLEATKKVYLDTKYWLLLRDAQLGRSRDPNVGALLVLLRRLVAERRVVCPISCSIFTEIFAQTDPTTLQASVDLIDELSTGVAIIQDQECFKLEFFHFLAQKTRGDTAVLPLDSLAWTRTAYVLGFVTPVPTHFPPDAALLMQKSFADYLWTVTLSDMFRQMGTAVHKFPAAFIDSAPALNDGKFAHLDDHPSFNEVFLSEIAGILDVFKLDLTELVRHDYELRTGMKPDTSSGDDNSGQMLANLMFHAFRLNKITAELPSLRVSAGLHAAVRWDRQRKYKRNDLHDFHHATAAVAYCDYFLTEHSLRQLLDHKQLQLSRYFRCQVFSGTEHSFTALSRLAA